MRALRQHDFAMTDRVRVKDSDPSINGEEGSVVGHFKTYVSVVLDNKPAPFGGAWYLVARELEKI